jgi:hypothetical protein
MRRRLAVLFALMLMLTASGALSLTPALAAPHVMAQESGGGDPTDAGDNAESSNKDGGKGQSDPAAESGAGGDTEEAEAPAGPPWTYQMARIALLLLVLIGVGILLAYMKLVRGRQRAGA